MTTHMTLSRAMRAQTLKQIGEFAKQVPLAPPLFTLFHPLHHASSPPSLSPASSPPPPAVPLQTLPPPLPALPPLHPRGGLQLRIQGARVAVCACVDVWMCACVDVWMCGDVDGCGWMWMDVDVWMCGCVDVFVEFWVLPLHVGVWCVCVMCVGGRRVRVSVCDVCVCVCARACAYCVYVCVCHRFTLCIQYRGARRTLSWVTVRSQQFFVTFRFFGVVKYDF